MTIRIDTYSLPLRLSALPLNEEKMLQASVRLSFKKALNYTTSFLPFLRGDVGRQRGRVIGKNTDIY